MGQRRYYLCPTDVIQVKELPSKWALLWISRGQVIVMREARDMQRETLWPRSSSSIRCSGAHKYASAPGRSRKGEAREPL